jgi:hypothetical protein
VVTDHTAPAASTTSKVQGRPNPTPQLAPPRDDGPHGCARKPASEDGPRRLVVSHPFDAKGEPSGAFEVMDVSADGALSRPGRTFTMGARAVAGTITFTPDREVGLVALDNGKLGVFRLDADGKPTVVHDAFTGRFDAGRVIMEPSGDRALVIDRNWREHGGGIYRVTIGCDGTLTDEGQVLPAKNPGAAAFAGDRLLVAAADAGDAPTPTPTPTSNTQPADNVFLFAQTKPPAKIGSAQPFANEQVIIGGSALTRDGKTFLVGDVNQYGDFPNQVAAVDVGDDGLKSAGAVKVPDPEAIAASPFGNVAIVTSAFNDAIQVIDRNGPQNTWRLRGPVRYSGGKPQLPGDVATIDRGKLNGHVYVSENSAVRHLAFREDGSVVDLGSLQTGNNTGNDLQSINGAIGVTR